MSSRTSPSSFPRCAWSLALSGSLSAVFLLFLRINALGEAFVHSKAKKPNRRVLPTRVGAFLLTVALVFPMTQMGLTGAEQILSAHGVDVKVVSGNYVTTHDDFNDGMTYTVVLNCETPSKEHVDVWMYIRKGLLTLILIQNRRGVI